MKKLLLAASLVLFGMNLHAQQIKRCGSVEYLKNLDKKYPGFEQGVKSLQDYMNTIPQKKTRGQVYIPVVVHIVYKNATENLSDAYVTAQIDQLNKDYARLNSDTTNLRAEFKPIAGAANIRFVLQQIKRKQTSNADFPMEFDWLGNNAADDVKVSANGGDDAVSPNTTLNIWVCDISVTGGEILGYAYPPPGLPNWGAGANYPSQALDGVVIDYIAFGGASKLPVGYSSFGCKGRTAVHEVGHYLGLRHIWGDDDGACQGQTDYEDDGISDTPIQADASPFNCNKTINSCNQGTGDLKDMVENYMDYSSESCQNSFTKGQVSFMENVLATIRTSIHMPTGIADPNPDFGIQIFPNPASNNININLTSLDEKQASILISDATGKIVYKAVHNALNELITINTEHMQAGAYFVKIQTGSKNYNQTIIKQ